MVGTGGWDRWRSVESEEEGTAGLLEGKCQVTRHYQVGGKGRWLVGVCGWARVRGIHTYRYYHDACPHLLRLQCFQIGVGGFVESPLTSTYEWNITFK